MNIKVLISSLLAVTFIAGATVGASAKGNSENGTKNEKTVSDYFEKAKDHQPSLIAFLQQMPKGADLHNHISAVIEIETVLKYAAAGGYDFDIENKKFVAGSDGNIGANYIKSDLLKELYNGNSSVVTTGERELIMSVIFDNLSMRNYEKSDENSHDLFFQYFFRTINVDASEYYKEVFTRAVNQNISYLELMTNLDDDVYYDQINAVKEQILKENGKKPTDLTVNFIATVNRNQSAERFKSKLAQAIAIYDNPKRHTVGITILSAEDDIISQQEFSAQMQAIDDAVKLRAENGQEPINFHLHGGELTLDYSEYEILTDRVSETVYTGHAKNVGHAVSVAWNNDVYTLLKYMRDNRIGVTICPTSNEAILGVAVQDNQFGLLWEADVPVAIATDDEGLSRTNLTNEFAKIITAFDLSYAEVKYLAFSSLDMSFVSGKSIFAEDNRDFSFTISEYNEMIVNYKNLTQKERLELDLFRRFYDFEKSMCAVIEDFGWAE
jgi:adenosine deaminase